MGRWMGAAGRASLEGQETDRMLSDLLDRRLRSNPAYELVEIERLTPVERQALAGLRDDPDCFGILRPSAESGLTIKSVCKETALLIYALREPGPLPAYLRSELEKDGGAGSQRIAELVLDGILEVEEEGGFVSGAEAHQLLSEPVEGLDNRGRLASLSLEAVRYGERLAIDEPLRLSAQMYFYNRSPVTPRWARRLRDQEAYEEYLGLAPGGACFETLQRDWDEVSAEGAQFGWRSWSLKRGGKRSRPSQLGFKLYISPNLESLPACLPAVLQAYTEVGVTRFKIGADLPGVTRPDKLVAYFHSFQEMEEAGRAIAEAVGDVAVQGVPFSAELMGDGLLSWGRDPRRAPVLEWQEAESWRLWITNQLAKSLLVARRSPARRGEGWRFALDRLRREGVDTDTWTPMGEFDERSGR